MVVKCAACKKRTVILYPQQWAYKWGLNTYFCSWKCLRAKEKEDLFMVEKVTKEQKEQAVQMAIRGEDPRPFLKECGSKNPMLMWGRIREQIMRKNPDLYEQLPNKFPQNGQQTAPAEKPKASGSASLIYDGFTVRCIECDYGMFFYDEKFSRLDWTTQDGEEVSMSPEAWKRLIKEILPTVMGILGVNA